MIPLNNDITNGNDDLQAENIGSAGVEQDRDASLAAEGADLAESDLRMAADATDLQDAEWSETYEDEAPRGRPRDEVPLAPELEAVHERRAEGTSGNGTADDRG